MIENIIWAIIVLFTVKTLMLGSEFSLYLWFKYGKNYFNWYIKREPFDKNKTY